MKPISKPDKFCKKLWKGPLYKYMKKEFAHKFVRNGSCRIGTLIDFKNQEKYSSGICDPHEGEKNRYCDKPVFFGDIPSQDHQFISKFVNFDSAKGFCATNVCYIERIHSHDCYVFSGTYEINPDAMDRMKYDAVVKIDSPEAFFRQMTFSLQQYVGTRLQGYFNYCVYDRYVNHLEPNSGSADPFLKGPEFSFQTEYRMIWYPPDDRKIDPIEPLYCGASLSKLCRHVSESDLAERRRLEKNCKKHFNRHLFHPSSVVRMQEHEKVLI